MNVEIMYVSLQDQDEPIAVQVVFVPNKLLAPTYSICKYSTYLRIDSERVDLGVAKKNFDLTNTIHINLKI